MPKTLKEKLAPDIIIPNICVKLYKNRWLNVGARAKTKLLFFVCFLLLFVFFLFFFLFCFFVLNSHSDLDLEPRTLTVKLDRDIIIPNIS